MLMDVSDTIGHEGEPKAQIVFIDDCKSILEGTRRALKHMQPQWDMHFFESPTQALDAIGDLCDFVAVTDWVMPDMDGLAFHDAARKVIQNKATVSAYFIVLTAKQGGEDAVQALEKGFDDFIAKPFHFGELIARIRVGVRLIQNERRLRQASDKLAFTATADLLTGLSNRRHGRLILDAEMARVRRGKQDIPVISADIDHLKTINETFGPIAEDRILAQFAAQLRFTFRNYDTPIRWGGEQFVIICPHTNSKEVVFAADRMIRNIRQMRVILKDETIMQITASIGCASTDSMSVDQLSDPVAAADKAMYQAKFDGGDRVCHFHAE
jgi:diguanylate cyclase (GGDEF)-like protein